MLYNRNCCKNTEKKNLKLAIYFLIVKHNVSTEESIKHKYTVKKKKKKTHESITQGKKKVQHL